MRLELLNFISRWGEPIDPISVPASYFGEYSDHLPDAATELTRLRSLKAPRTRVF